MRELADQPFYSQAVQERMRLEWREAVAKGKPCANCGSRLFVQAHHVLYKQHIRSIAQTAGIDPAPWMWDARNGLPICKVCHGRHHSAHPWTIPRGLLVVHSPRAFQFARELGPVAVAHLRSSYPTAV